MRFVQIIIPVLLLSGSCSSRQNQLEMPERVPRIIYEIYPNDWYIAQEKLWKLRLDKNPQDADAWLNYYNAVRYTQFEQTIDTPSKQERLNRIVTDMGKEVTESFEYCLVKFKSDNNYNNIYLIEKAHQLRPDAPDPYYDLITYHEMKGNMDQVKQYFQALYKTQDVAQWLLNYNFNVLMSLDENALLFTNGDNDTYPIRLLQEVKNIRPDVTVMNIHLATIESYFTRNLKQKGIELNHSAIFRQGAKTDAAGKKQFDLSLYVQALTRAIAEKAPQVPLYFACTVYQTHIRPFTDDLYIVGLAYRYSPKRIDNIALLKKHFEKDFRLDYIQYDWYNDLVPGKRLMGQINLNYAPPAIMLAEHYQTTGDVDRARHWQKFAQQVAEAADNQELIDDIQQKFK